MHRIGYQIQGPGCTRCGVMEGVSGATGAPRCHSARWLCPTASSNAPKVPERVRHLPLHVRYDRCSLRLGSDCGCRVSLISTDWSRNRPPLEVFSMVVRNFLRAFIQQSQYLCTKLNTSAPLHTKLRVPSISRSHTANATFL